ncbi:CHAT domain-containing protein [Vannielia litorea]|uniref:CHAT domain-containing protein n=1 Tax=Vannielia litorea TaxID=1217970 RepID=UPI001C949FE1|nr:CHAT domain-containing protein [Vannielia litorea]MBY6047782.1 CHAT domain-containing protein [Vannielia litorea]MBY6075196.1 CHAT domain-containing protein [Vannielia litorea]
MLRPALLLALALSLAGLPLRAESLSDRAFQAAQLAMLSSAGSAIRQAELRRSAGTGPLADLLKARQRVADRRARAEAELGALGRDGTADTSAATRLSGEIDALSTEITQLETRIAAEFPRFAEMTRPRPMTLAEVQAALAPEEGLLFIYTGARETHIWAITPEHSAWQRIELGEADIAADVAALRLSLKAASNARGAEALKTLGQKPQITPFDRTRAFLVYADLLSGVMPTLARTDQLYTVAQGPLTGIPLGLLVTDAPGDASQDGDPGALRRTPWLFQRFALASLPTVESLRAIAAPSRAQATPPTGRFLGIGAPKLTGGATGLRGVKMAGATADPESIRALAPLPGTLRELRAIATTLGAGPDALLTGDAAVEPALRSAGLEQAEIVVFATHGLLSGELEGLAEPALVLTPPQVATATDDGLLTASEIADMTLTAEWVILSACNTAGGDGRPDAEGLSGLARAFLVAGAKTLMVSHWPVRDDAAARLTTDAFAALEQPDIRHKSKALQASMQAMLEDESDPTLAHPAAWAPFILVGDGR